MLRFSCPLARPVAVARHVIANLPSISLSISAAPVVVALIVGGPAEAQTVEVPSGDETVFRPYDPGVNCYHGTTGVEGLGTDALSSCEVGQGTVPELLALNGSLLAANVSATAGFRFRFSIAEAQDAQTESFLPVKLQFPNIKWSASVQNDVFINSAAQFVIKFRLFEVDDLNQRHLKESKVVYNEVRIGSENLDCFFFSLDPIDLAIGALQSTPCIAGKIEAVFSNDGRASPSMLTILATGRTYVLELESKAVARNGLLTAGGLISAGLPTNSSGVPAPQPDPVLKWDTLVLTVGSDPQAIVAPHTHDYRTGRGSGHNRLEAESSLPN